MIQIESPSSEYPTPRNQTQNLVHTSSSGTSSSSSSSSSNINEEEAVSRENTLQNSLQYEPDIITESIIHQDNTPVQLPISPRKTSTSSSQSQLNDPKLTINTYEHSPDLNSSKKAGISPPVRPVSISTYTSDDEETKLAESRENVEKLKKEQFGSVQSKMSEYSSTYRPADGNDQTGNANSRNDLMNASEVLEVSIVKRESAGLGFAISERIIDDGTRQNKGFIIQSVVPGGAASATHEIIGGDQLVSVEGKLLEGLALKDVVNILKALSAGIINVGIKKQPKVIQGK